MTGIYIILLQCILTVTKTKTRRISKTLHDSLCFTIMSKTMVMLINLTVFTPQSHCSEGQYNLGHLASQ